MSVMCRRQRTWRLLATSKCTRLSAEHISIIALGPGSWSVKGRLMSDLIVFAFSFSDG